MNRYLDFQTFPVDFCNPNYLNSNCPNVIDLGNLQEQVQNAFCFKNCTDLSLFNLTCSNNNNIFDTVQRTVSDLLKDSNPLGLE